MLELEIVNGAKFNCIPRIMVYARIPLSKESKDITDDELNEVIPHILSTHRLHNGNILRCIVKKVVFFNPFAIDSLLVIIEGDTGCHEGDKEKGSLTAIRVIEDLSKRYSNENAKLVVNVFGANDLPYDRKRRVVAE